MTSALLADLERELLLDVLAGHQEAAALVAAAKGFRPVGAPGTWPEDRLREALEREETGLRRLRQIRRVGLDEGALGMPVIDTLLETAMRRVEQLRAAIDHVRELGDAA